MKSNHIKYIPNFITSIRIICSVILLFMKPLSISFYVLYILTGMTDALDGFIARKFHAVSNLGAKLDSIADLMFYSVLFLKVFPVLLEIMPAVFWYMFCTIIILRIFSYGIAALKFHQLASLHTVLNKLTGFTAFFIPFYLLLPQAVLLCFAVGVISFAGTVQELILHIRRKE